MTENCPACDSPQPHLHPAVQVEGEVQVCTNEFHLTPTPQNTDKYINGVLAQRHAKTSSGQWHYDQAAETICDANGEVIGRMEQVSGPLAAAAPDMLAELKRLYEIHGYQSTFDVIAKAEGR